MWKLFIIAALIGIGVRANAQDNSSNVGRLISQSKQGLALGESELLLTGHFSKSDIRSAGVYILSHHDCSSYHLLMMLHKDSPASYAAIPDSVRAAILSCALAHVTPMNDWDHLNNPEPSARPAVQALLGTGAEGVRYLRPLLDSCGPARFYGSEDATLSSVHEYRRCDFAYRYIMFILKKKPLFHPMQVERDVNIRELKRFLDAG